jgi:hypothetical protein
MFQLSSNQYGLPANEDGPAERLRIIHGRAKSDSKICDRCSKPFESGEEIVAVTVWLADRHEIPSWEDDYLEAK